MIVKDILEGVSSGKDKYDVIHDRGEAIEHAINTAQPGDMIIIAGKGHETTQTLKDTTIEFNDVKVADEFVVKRLGKA